MDKLKFIILLICLLPVWCSCEKDKSPDVFSSKLELREPTEVGRTYLRLNGRLSNDTGVSETGFVYWKSGYPADSVKVLNEDSVSTGVSVWLENLKGNESYDFYLYATNGKDRILSATGNFRTAISGKPLVSEIVRLADRPNVFQAYVKDDGVADGLKHLKEIGVCWNTEGNPLITDNRIQSDGQATGFTVQFTAMQDNSVYYMRAYAENDNQELSYGKESRFETGKIFPQIGEVIVSSLMEKRFASSVPDIGGGEILTKGFCWNQTGDPTIGDEKVEAQEDFSATLENLKPGTDYYVRAYAGNLYGVVYSEEVHIRIPLIPELGEIRETDTESHTCHAEILNDGGSEVIERGFCWNQTGEPTTMDHVVAAGNDFTAALGELSPGVYYVRAFATNIAGTGYSHTLTINVRTQTVPILGNIEQIEVSDNTFRSVILDTGGNNITEYGFCWNRTGEPTLFDEFVKADSDFTASLGELEPGVYYIRAYAVNGRGVGYSPTLIITVKSPTAPVLGEIERTSEILNMFRCIITDKGGSDITERGFCWNQTGEPTLSDSNVRAGDSFIVSLGDLEAGDYYIRAYAVNQTGVGYSTTYFLRVESIEPEEILE